MNGPGIVIEIPQQQLERPDRVLKASLDALTAQARKMSRVELYWCHAIFTGEMVGRGMCVMHIGVNQ